MNDVSAADLGPPPLLDAARAAFFLDFDGTLAPIVARPDLAAMSTATADAVLRLEAAAGGALAVVSGRTLESLDARLAPMRFAASGSHGLERRGVDGATHVVDGGDAMAAAIEVVEAFGAAHGLLVERKPAGAAIHYRGRPDMAAQCRAAVEAAAAGRDCRIVHGNMIAEFSAAVATKGTAVEAFMTETPFRDRMPVFAGDDVTDEDGFRAVARLGGVGIKVGAGETAASHRVADIEAFLNWMGRLTRG